MSGRRARQARTTSSGPDWSALSVQMLQEDVAWVSALVLSTIEDKASSSMMGLLVLPHMSRVAHEGSQLLAQLRPAEARAFQRRFPDEMAAARHTVKLFDDTEKGLAGVVKDFERIEGEHERMFAPERSLSIATHEGRLCASSRITSYHVTAALDDRGVRDRTRSKTYQYSVDVGVTLRELLRFFGKAVPSPRLHAVPPNAAPRLRDTDRSVYLRTRFASTLPFAVKDALLLVESAVNSALDLFAYSEDAYVMPLFRTRMLAAAHACSALQVVRDTYEASSPGVDALLTDAATARLLSRRGLRNQCMHYGIPPSLTGLDASKTGLGLVEAIDRSDTFDAVAREVNDVLQRLSDVLAEWRPYPGRA